MRYLFFIYFDSLKQVPPFWLFDIQEARIVNIYSYIFLTRASSNKEGKSNNNLT